MVYFNGEVSKNGKSRLKSYAVMHRFSKVMTHHDRANRLKVKGEEIDCEGENVG